MIVNIIVCNRTLIRSSNMDICDNLYNKSFINAVTPTLTLFLFILTFNHSSSMPTEEMVLTEIDCFLFPWSSVLKEWT